MTLSTAFLFILGRRLSLRDRRLVKESLSYLSYEDLRRFAFDVVRVTLLFEGVGTLLLFLYFHLHDGMAGLVALGHGAFQTVSAFCNAGFSSFSNNLIGYGSSYFVPLVVAFEFILGGLGFVVLVDLYRTRLRRIRPRLSAHSKLVLRTTLGLILAGTLLILGLEWGKGLDGCPIPQKLLTAFFQAVTPRTAGFTLVEIKLFQPVTALLIVMLMFIGASPGGTGGGIKTTTFAIIWAQVRSFLRGRSQPVAVGRRLSPEQGTRAFIVFAVSAGVVLTALVLLMIIEDNDMVSNLFEVVSAFGTVGLSRGSRIVSNLSLAHDFSWAGKLILCLVMLTGRVGTLTVGGALIPVRSERVRYPAARISVG
jgi:trk system potassium uptake protein TrkH